MADIMNKGCCGISILTIMVTVRTTKKNDRKMTEKSAGKAKLLNWKGGLR